MKKWQNLASKFLVVVLLSANLVSLAPTVQAVNAGDYQKDAVTVVGDDSPTTTLETTEPTVTAGSEATKDAVTSGEDERITVAEEEAVEQTTNQTAATAEEVVEEKEAKETIPVQLLGINDFHGALNTTGTAYLESGKVEKVGRAANLATHLDEAEATFTTAHENGQSIRVQAGDMVGASPANSALLQDESTIRALNQMKIRYGTLGNHEFDEGLAEFRRIIMGQAPEPGQFNQITQDYNREPSTMEIVVANVVNKSDDGQPEGFQPYVVETIGEGDKQVKIGFIGVVTTEFPNLVLKKHHDDYNVLDEAETIVKYSKKLRDQGVNAIVVLGHVAATSSQDTVQGEVANVMAKVNQLDADNSVDAFFAGHNHQYTNGVIKNGEVGARVVQSTSQGKAYIDLQGEIDVETKDFVEIPTANVKPTTDVSNKNAEIVAIVDEADKLVKTVTEEKVGVAEKAEIISRGVNNNNDKESFLGNLITDAQLHMANQEEIIVDGKPLKVDFALTNNGGIRADLKVKEDGVITWGAAQEVQPFGNILQVVAISGKDLKGALNEQFAGDGKYFLQVAGLSYTYSLQENKPNSVQQVLDAEGKALNDEQLYHIVINDFLLGGGDGFTSFTKGQLVTAIDTDTDTFINYFKEMDKQGKKISAPTLGRKTEAKESQGKVIPIQMLGLNDYHGAIETTGTAYLESGKFEKVGKASNLAAHLDEAQANFAKENANAYTERVQGGDLVGASPANSALLQDEPTIKIFNRMNFGVGTIGNHEFDEGLAEFKRIMDGVAPKKGQFNPIVDSYPREKSTQEVVLANVVNKADGEHGKKGEVPYDFKPYTVKSYGQGAEAVKVGYIGIVTTEFKSLVLKQHHENYDVLDEADTIVKYSKELRGEGVNAIVIVSHLAATSNKEVVKGEVVDVMAKVDKLDPDNSVDVVFAGHNHQYTNGVIKGAKNDVRVVQSTSQGKAYIDVQGELDSTTKDFVEAPKAEVKPTTDRPDKNQEIEEIVAHANETVRPVTEAKVGLADEAATKAGMISRENNEHSESALGNLITDSQLYMANQADLKDEDGNSVKADFALTNNGGIREDLKLTDTGEITWGAAQAVQPFGNILQIVAISGKDLKGALNEQHANGKTHYFLQIAGLKMTYTQGDEGFNVKTVTDNKGNAINDEQTYNIIINDFLLGGGDGFASFTKGKLVAAMDTDTTTFVEYFELMEKAGKKITAPETNRKVLDDGTAGQVTTEELEEATTVSPIKEGDTEIKGTTIAGTTVSYTVNKKRSVIGLPKKVETTDFTLAITEPVVAGDTLTVQFVNGNAEIEQKMTVAKKDEVTPPLTVEKLEELTTVNKLKAGDKEISGKTAKGTLVSYVVGKKVKTAGEPMTTTTESFKFSLATPLVGGEVVTLTFKNGDTSITREITVEKIDKPINPDPGNGLTLEQLKNTSKVKAITEGDTAISGQSVAGTAVTYSIGEPVKEAKSLMKAAEKPTVTMTDAQGNFSFTDIPETLKKGEKVSVTFTNGDLTTTVDKIVGEKKTDQPVNKGNGTGKGTAGKKDYLPLTGEAESLSAILGMIILMSGYLYYIRKRKETNQGSLK